MATILPVDEIIEIGKASTYLSANYVSHENLWGGTMIKPNPPITIAMVTDALEWGYEGGAQTEASLRSTGNYAYWVYGLFQLQAQNIIDGGGGGSVTPTPSGGTLPTPLYFLVAADTFIATGESTVTMPSSWTGYNLQFARNGVVQTNVNSEPSYFDYNTTTRQFTITPAAFEGELFALIPV